MRPLYDDDIDPILDHDSNFVRDRIVVLGRPKAGKTVFLSLLYEMLWKSKCTLRMKALKGVHHATFMTQAAEIHQAIKNGTKDYQAGTLGTTQTHIEIIEAKKSRVMVALDYSGEVFQNAFINDRVDEHTETLLDHIDHAQAVILLVDPEHVDGSDIAASIDNDYAILQAITRIQNWPGGCDVPIVLVLTKIDVTEQILKKNGGTKAFVNKYFYDLITTTRHLKVCKISAKNRDGTTRKNRSYTCTSFVTPLRYCLDKIIINEQIVEQNIKEHRTRKYTEEMAVQARKQNIVACITFLGIFIALIWLVTKILPSTVWSNLWYNIAGP